ncbi:MAG: hypothetical protein KAJ55_02200 [Anaerolineales bacterium]|nr:hypothetical protein [Anaerolineales bacterium]
MILETVTVKTIAPAVTKVALSAGQLIFAGTFLALGFQFGHTMCRKGIEWWDHRNLAKLEQESEEPNDTGSVPNGTSKQARRQEAL